MTLSVFSPAILGRWICKGESGMKDGISGVGQLYGERRKVGFATSGVLYFDLASLCWLFYEML